MHYSGQLYDGDSMLHRNDSLGANVHEESGTGRYIWQHSRQETWITTEHTSLYWTPGLPTKQMEIFMNICNILREEMTDRCI